MKPTVNTVLDGLSGDSLLNGCSHYHIIHIHTCACDKNKNRIAMAMPDNNSCVSPYFTPARYNTERLYAVDRQLRARIMYICRVVACEHLPDYDIRLHVIHTVLDDLNNNAYRRALGREW